MQTCSKCGEPLPLSAFYFRKDQRKHRKDCKACVLARNVYYKAKNADEIKKWHAENYRKRIAEDPDYHSRKYWADPDKARRENRENYIRHRERRIADAIAWARNNPGKARANKAAYKAAKIRATPPWADMGVIQMVYECAVALGLEVDHIVPLRGDTVSGLHVPWNLQLLTREENARKSNRLYA